MRIEFIIAIVIILIALAALLPRKSVHAELQFEQSAAVVWAAIVDTGGYDAWNPIFQKLRGEFVAGTEMAFEMRVSDGSFSPVTAKVVAVTPEQLLHQSAGIPGVLTANHQWRLEANDAGTLVIQHEEYRGAGVLFYNPAYVQTLYQQGLEALRERFAGAEGN
ncbi:MAG: SRPBCC family protein [Pseudomonadota bacterium]